MHGLFRVVFKSIEKQNEFENRLQVKQKHCVILNIGEFCIQATEIYVKKIGCDDPNP